MAKEEKKSVSTDMEKLDIEDIKGPEDEDDLDIEEAVSEPEGTNNMPDEDVDTAESPDSHADTAEVLDEEKANKSTGSKHPESDAQPSTFEKGAAEKDVLEEAVEATRSEKIYEEESNKRPHSAKASRGKWKTVLMILISVLVTAALVLGGVYWYMSTQNKEEPKKEEPRQEETKKENTTATTEKVVYVSPAEGLRLRKEPNPNAEILATMPQGTKLVPLETQGDWIKAEYQGKTGWCLSTYTSAENPLVYKDTKYGFQITFPEAWAGYKFFEKNIDGAIVFYLGLPTTQAGWTGTGVDAGYSSMFAISVYTKAQWATASAEEGPKPTKLGEKGDYVFAWSQAQATPKDLEKRFAEISSVIDTFKVI